MLLKYHELQDDEYLGSKPDATHYDTLIQYNEDIYDEETGKCVIKFRKGKIRHETIQNAYEAIKDHSKHKTTIRNIAGGSKGAAMNSNIIGFYVDNIGNNTVKKRVRSLGIEKSYRSNITRWNRANQETFDKCIMPLLNELCEAYRELLPDIYQLHLQEANRTEFHISNTPFSTVTINRDTTMAYHTDKKNSKIGYGNLIVYEGSPYEGSYLVFPNYRIAVDVRQGDLLIMNQHILHGNMPLIKTDNSADCSRVSFVSYLHNDLIRDLERNPSIDHYKEYCRLVALANAE